MKQYVFSAETLAYIIEKFKEKFATRQELDGKVDKAEGKVLSANDYSDNYVQKNNQSFNDIIVSNQTDEEIELTFKSNEKDHIVAIPYDKYKKSAMFVYQQEDFECMENAECQIRYEYISCLNEGTHSLIFEVARNGETIEEEIGYDYGSVPDYYLYVPSLGDTKIGIYFVDPEGTKTGITYLNPTIKPEPIVTYTTTDTSMRPVEITGLTSGYTAEVNDNQVMLFKNNSSDVVTYINFRDTNSLTNISYMASSITNMYHTYRNCINLTGSPVCGPNVTDMSDAYHECWNLTGSPACGPNVTNMSYTYARCTGLTGSPACGPNVTDMSYTYYNCRNLTGSPVCGDNITSMSSTYHNCQNLTGSPVCGDKVTKMYRTYYNCANLTGHPVCGPKVTTIAQTYYNCQKLNLAGTTDIGPNVTNMYQTFYGCSYNNSSYFEDEWTRVIFRIYSPNVSNAQNCFYGHNAQRPLLIFLLNNTTTFNTFVQNAAAQSITGTQLAIKNDMDFHGCWYDSTNRISIYPVDTVEEIDIRHLQLEGYYISLYHGISRIMEGVNSLQDVKGVEYVNFDTGETTGWYFDDLASNLVKTLAVPSATEAYSLTHNGNTIVFEKSGETWHCGITMSGSGWTSEDYTGYSVLFY